MLAPSQTAEAAEFSSRYWLNVSGQAFPVTDHLQSAQYVKAASDEFDSPGPWTFEDMWRRGWARVRIDDGTIEVQVGPDQQLTPAQSAWLNAVDDGLLRRGGRAFAAVGWKRAEVGGSASKQPVPLTVGKLRTSQPPRTVEAALAQVQRLREQSSRRGGEADAQE
jgi:hypothetical protein